MYQVTYTFSVMADNEYDAKEVAFEYADRGQMFDAKEVVITTEEIIWLHKLCDLLDGTWESWEEKYADLRVKHGKRFGITMSETDWECVMGNLERYQNMIQEDLIEGLN